MAMDIFILASQGTGLRLPVNPSELQVEAAGKTETLSIIGLGQIELPAGATPVSVSFNSFFPRDYDRGYCRYPGIPRPEEALRKILDWWETGEPVRLLVTESVINLLVFVARVNYRYVGGEPGDIYYDLSLRQWRPLQVTAAATSAVPARLASRRPDTRPVPAIYTVVSGDTLYGIAKRELGQGTRWRDIYNLNTGVIGPDPHLIKPGQKLVMPT